MKIHGLKEVIRDYNSGDFKYPEFLYYPEGDHIEVCQHEDCHGDAFESLPDYYEIENITEYMKEDYMFGNWLCNEISEENLRAYIEWRFEEEVNVDEH